MVPIKPARPERTVPIKAARPSKDLQQPYLTTRDGSCKFITVDGTSVFDKLCCGALAYRPGGSFCEYHHKLSYHKLGAPPNAPAGPDSVGVPEDGEDQDEAA